MKTSSQAPAPAVLLLGFNRPDLLGALLDKVSTWNTPRIYVSVDGPREGVELDQIANDKIQELVRGYSGEAPLLALFHTENLGCKRAVVAGISWFFGHEDRGVVLEDDCIPVDSFYPYCAELLEVYKEDLRVFSISGYRALPPGKGEVDSFSFSRYPQVWGWATWKRVWSRFDEDIVDWPHYVGTERLQSEFGLSPISARYWSNKFEAAFRGRIDTWDYQLLFHALKSRGLTAIPEVNLVQNLGFDARSTHTNRAPRHVSELSHEIQFPLSFPATVVRDINYDVRLERRAYRRIRSIIFHTINKNSSLSKK